MTSGAQRDPRFDVLFEPVAIGPVTAKNRFFQVPHCNGMGHRDPTALAWMRGVKAEGGWAVVCTEEVEIHPTSDVAPFIELRLWDDRDIPMLARTADRIHEFGALAGIELAHNGPHAANHYAREVPLAASAMPVTTAGYEPLQARAMDKQDIGDLRRWHRAAALRAREAGFDLVYVYAGHALSILHHFLSRHHNRRSDEYGGSARNRVRLLEELLTDTREAVGDACAVPCRIALDELLGAGGLEKAEVEELIGLIAELPDLWDLSLAAWPNDSMTSRFGDEGWQEPFVQGVKTLTTKPVGSSWGATPRPTGWSRSSTRGSPTSSAAPGLPSPTPTCPGRSRKGASTTSANASAATSASRATSPCRRSAAPRTRP